MKGITFDLQIRVALLIAIIGFTAAIITSNGLVLNLTGVFYGMMFAINPVVPDIMLKYKNSQRLIRLFGFIIAGISMLVQFR